MGKNELISGFVSLYTLFFFPEYFNLWKEGIMQKVQRKNLS